jgi:hypothetical protein
MNWRPRRTAQLRKRFHARSWVLAAGLACTGCVTNGDFGRIKPSLVHDDMHAWLAQDAAVQAGRPVSGFTLTEDEQQLRDLAYPLIEPPYDRQRWYSILGEYGLMRVFRPDWWFFDPDLYTARLIVRHRSASGRYAQLIEDIRNDIVRIDPFFFTARRVVDMDRKREKSLAYVTALTPGEAGNALARIGENTLVVQWVHRSLADRCATYRFALERLVIENPLPAAVEADRVLRQLQITIAQNQIVPALKIRGGGRPVAVRAGENRVIAKY